MHRSLTKNILLILIFLLPTVLLFELDSRGFMVHRIVFIGVMAISFLGPLFLIPRKVKTVISPSNPLRNQRVDNFTEEPTFHNLFLPEKSYLDADQKMVYVGKLLEKSDKAYDQIYQRFIKIGYIPMLLENLDEKSTTNEPSLKLVIAPEYSFERQNEKSHISLDIGLFLLTILSIVWVMSKNESGSLIGVSQFISNFFPALLLVGTLLICETFRQWFARFYYQIKYSLPYFLPIPIGFGTFGTFTQIRNPVINRKILLQITLVGSLLLIGFGLWLFFIGFEKSEILPFGYSSGKGYQVNLGSSLFLSSMGKLFFGIEMGRGHMISLTPVTFVGWLLILISSLNLIPMGELSGGRIVRSVFSPWQVNILDGVIWVILLFLGVFSWAGWIVFAGVVFFFSYQLNTTVLDQVSSVPWWQKIVSGLAFVFAFFVLIPLPHSFYQILGLHCPYI